VTWPLERTPGAFWRGGSGFDPADTQAIAMWDTVAQALMFGRMIGHMSSSSRSSASHPRWAGSA